MKMRLMYAVTLAGPLSLAGVLHAAAQNEVAGAPVPPAVGRSSTPGASLPGEDHGAQAGDSHVRIVRLSDVKGTVALDRKTGNGFEATMPNMPIIEGEKLRTAEGYAEVEFEDNSTVRVTPHSLVEFPLLALRVSGAKASTINVVHGMVYVNLEGTKASEFLLVAGGQKITVSPATHLRIMVEGAKTEVSVFNGSAEIQHGSEITLVTKKQTMTLGADQATVAKKVEEEPSDAWDKDSNDYHARYSRANTFAGSGSSYGLSDLNYYGSFTNAGGYGSFWQPYLAGAGWDPYGNGVWAMYPGAGYSWVSPYPWGWLPYHSGTWSFFPGYGWGWQPGGSWNGLNNVVAVSTPAGSTAGQTPLRSPLRPAPPQVAVKGAAPSLVLAGGKPLVFSKADSSGNFVFQKASAGLGVPRGSLGSLSKVSNHVEQHGSASMPVYAAGTSLVSSRAGASAGPVTLRPGSPVQNSNAAFSSAPQSGTHAGSAMQPTASSHMGTSSASAGGGHSGGSSK